MDISKIKVGSTSYDVKDAAARENKADTDGNYPDLVAGNIVGEFNQEAEVSFRPSAGTVDIQSGYKVNYGGHLEGVKGNTVAMNQQIKNGDFSDGTTDWYRYNQTYIDFSVSNKVMTVTTKAETVGSDNSAIVQNLPCVAGHKYFVKAKYTNINNSDLAPYIEWASVSGNRNLPSEGEIIQAAISGTKQFLFKSGGAKAVGDSWTWENIFIIDLTLMFGAGNEPATPADFEADYMRWFGKPLSYEAYNAGELIPVKMAGLLTVGFNQWDEEWRNGYYYDGVFTANNNYVASSNYIKVFGGKDYYFNLGASASCGVTFYDSNKNLITGIPGSSSGNRKYISNGTVATMPDNAAYITFFIDGTTYNHDICINISHSGERNGEYEPYWSSLLPFDVTKVYGKLNGEGNYVQVFPDGMRSAGTVYDAIDITNRIAKIKVYEKILTGTEGFTRRQYGDVYLFIVPFINSAPSTNCCNNYYAEYRGNVTLIDNLSLEFNGYDVSYGGAYIRDDRFLDANEFKNYLASLYSSNKPLILFYELAEPLVYTDLVYRENGVDYPLDGPLPYKVDDYGTEEVVAISGQRTVAPVLQLRYGINAGDTIRNLPFNYLSPKMQQTFTEAEQRQARKNIGVDITRADVLALIRSIGHIEFVDMGLPSGRLWASKNLGAETITDYGAYFSWGNVQGHKPNGTTFDYDFGLSNFDLYSSTEGAFLSGDIPEQQDAANFYLGGTCRMPTKDDFVELFNSNYTKFIDDTGTEVTGTDKLITLHGVVGIYLMSKINGNKLFFPCAGFGHGSSLNNTDSYGGYWSASSYGSAGSHCLYFNSSNVDPAGDNSQFFGLSVRAVL